MKLGVLLASAALLGACAPYPPPAPYPAPAPAPWPGPPPVYAPPAGDQCGAGRHQWLIGRSHAEIPPRPPGALWRVVARGDAVTRDLRPGRLNIIYDRHTHRILEVYCG